RRERSRASVSRCRCAGVGRQRMDAAHRPAAQPLRNRPRPRPDLDTGVRSAQHQSSHDQECEGPVQSRSGSPGLDDGERSHRAWADTARGAQEHDVGQAGGHDDPGARRSVRGRQRLGPARRDHRRTAGLDSVRRAARLAGALLLVLCSTARADALLPGHWEGAFSRLGSIQEVALDVRPDLSGTFDIPALGCYGVALENLSATDTSASFRLLYGTFHMLLHPADLEMTGENRDWGPPVSLHLRRTARTGVYDTLPVPPTPEA